MRDSQKYVAQIEEMLGPENRLLFLTAFGSHLYGTAVPGKSDTDFRGLFLPSMKLLALGEVKKDIHLSTGGDNARNQAEDIDIDLWSIQYWLLRLLPVGDTGATDLLFAPSNAACTIFRDPRLDMVFSRPKEFINLNGQNGYAAYSMGQAKKYGIKGSRLGAVKRVHEWLQNNCPQPARIEKFSGEIFESLARDCHDEHHCFIVRRGPDTALQLCGKLHMRGIPLLEFKQRVEEHYRQYGQRARDAEENRGVDFKALSHAMRALDQIEELVQTGKISYPLKNADALLEIKRGNFPWVELEPMILKRLAEIQQLCSLPESRKKFGPYNFRLAKQIILGLYGLAE